MRNVILLTVDSMRPDHLSCYGYSRMTSPMIDELARDGIQYMSAFTQGPNTRSAFLSILGGIYPSAVGTNFFLPDYATCLAEPFRDAGYHTAAIHTNPWVSRYYGYSRGFDRFYDSFQRTRKEKGMPWRRKMLKRLEVLIKRYNVLFRSLLWVREHWPGKWPFEERPISERLMAYLDRTDEPFFIWAHFMGVHYPLTPSPREVEAVTGMKTTFSEISRINSLIMSKRAKELQDKRDVIIALYDTMIHRVDAEIGYVLHMLKERGLYKKSIIVLTSDHGEDLLDHGRMGHPATFYEVQIRVPLIVAGNGRGMREHMTQLIDLPPTLLRWSGIDPPPTFMGEDLDKRKDYVFSEVEMKGGIRACVRTRSWKLQIFRDIERVELYDLTEDPEERRNLAGERKVGVEVLSDLIETHLKDVRRRSTAMKAMAIRKRMEDDLSMTSK